MIDLKVARVRFLPPQILQVHQVRRTTQYSIEVDATSMCKLRRYLRGNSVWYARSRKQAKVRKNIKEQNKRPSVGVTNDVNSTINT